jgi:hypothetical protein
VIMKQLGKSRKLPIPAFFFVVAVDRRLACIHD